MDMGRRPSFVSVALGALSHGFAAVGFPPVAGRNWVNTRPFIRWAHGFSGDGGRLPRARLSDPRDRLSRFKSERTGSVWKSAG